MIKRLCVFFGVMLLSLSAWALDLREAKSRGLVGEANNGYLAAVVANPASEVTALIKEVNAARKKIYIETAGKHNLTVAQVAHRAYERAVEKTASGDYYQDSRGNWVRKP
jgi:uncharacterized protein YdbL (DUF1318 family)